MKMNTTNFVLFVCMEGAKRRQRPQAAPGDPEQLVGGDDAAHREI
jgi:hypothetical protein